MAIFDEPSRKPLPTTPELEDHRAAVIKGALHEIPILGSVLAAEMDLILVPPLSRRRDEWLEDLARRLHDLEGRVAGFKFEDLANNEQFVSATMQATQAALRTHQAEKLDALKNTVLNTALDKVPDDNRRAVFLALIDRLTPIHVSLLKGFQNPAGPRPGMDHPYLAWDWSTFYRALQHEPGFSEKASKLTLWVKDFIPLLANESEDFIKMLLGDLYAAGLITVTPTDKQVASVFKEIVTPVGVEFLSFITAPKEIETAK
jgi:hypothetical protein